MEKKQYTYKIKNRITFKIKTGYYLELLTPETMKLLGSTKSKITKNKNDKNFPYLEFTEVVLIHYNNVNNSYESCIHFFLINFRSIIRYFNSLYVLVMSRTSFRVNPHSIVAWMSWNFLLEAGVRSKWFWIRVKLHSIRYFT